MNEYIVFIKMVKRCIEKSNKKIKRRGLDSEYNTVLK